MRGCDSLFSWFRLDICSLDLEHFCLYTSSKNLVGFLSTSLVGTPWSTSQGLCKADYSNRCSDSAVHYGSHACHACHACHAYHAFRGGVLPFGPDTPRSNYSHCISVPQFGDHSAHCKVGPTEKSDHKALEDLQESPHKFISHSSGKRYVFWTLQKSVSSS